MSILLPFYGPGVAVARLVLFTASLNDARAKATLMNELKHGLRSSLPKNS
jgi:hypothetical protein